MPRPCHWAWVGVKSCPQLNPKFIRANIPQLIGQHGRSLVNMNALTLHGDARISSIRLSFFNEWFFNSLAKAIFRESPTLLRRIIKHCWNMMRNHNRIAIKVFTQNCRQKFSGLKMQLIIYRRRQFLSAIFISGNHLTTAIFQCSASLPMKLQSVLKNEPDVFNNFYRIIQQKHVVADFFLNSPTRPSIFE